MESVSAIELESTTFLLSKSAAVVVVVEEIKVVSPPLPANLDTDITGFEEFAPKEETNDLENLPTDEDNTRHLNHKCIWMLNNDYEKFQTELKEAVEKRNQPKIVEVVIVEEDEILSDLDDLIENYDEELQKREDAELAQMKKELLEKIEQEQKQMEQKQIVKKPTPVVKKPVVKKPTPKQQPKQIIKKTIKKPIKS